MNGPPRLRDGAGPAQRLLRSAALDVPSAASRKKLLAIASTAVAGVVTTSAAAAASTATLTKSVILYVFIGTIGGGALALGASEISTRVLEAPSAKPLVRAAAPRKPSAIGAAPLEPSQPAPEPSPALPEAAQDQPSVVRPLVRDAAPAAAPGDAKPPLLTQPSLFEEVKLIEAARAAVGRGDAGAALSTLDRYDRAFPRGQFGPEALALRVEALAAAGNSARARALAGEFARRYPSHPLLARVRAAAP